MFKANSVDPDQTSRSVASDQGLHYLLKTLLRVSSLKFGNRKGTVRRQIFK